MLVHGDGESTVTMNSLRVKYLRFCFDTHGPDSPRWPAFPFTLGTLLEYVLWLRDHGIGSFASAANYVAALVAWGQENDQEDLRQASPLYEATWSFFKGRVIAELPIKRRSKPKLKMHAAYMECLALDADTSSAEVIKHLAAWVLLFFSGIRVGHVAAKRRNMLAHVLAWGNIQILDNEVRIWLGSTKTRPLAANDGYWTSIAARPDGLCTLDPVRMFRLWHRVGFMGDSSLPLFPARASACLAMQRNEFTSALRTALGTALLRLPGEAPDVRRLTGISFRKSVVSSLWNKVPTHRVLEAVDHKTISASVAYGHDDTLDRAANTFELAKDLAPGF